VIPKKQARSAVLRNAVKRQVREIFRQRRMVLPKCDLIMRLTVPLSRRFADDLGQASSRQVRRTWRSEMIALFDQLCNQFPEKPRPVQTSKVR
jgi:ribonuclease P protein component